MARYRIQADSLITIQMPTQDFYELIQLLQIGGGTSAYKALKELNKAAEPTLESWLFNNPNNDIEVALNLHAINSFISALATKGHYSRFKPHQIAAADRYRKFLYHEKKLQVNQPRVVTQIA